jgi:hypothetical protein
MPPMNIIIACEFSGKVREAMRARGHNAYSCDLEPAEGVQPSPYHIQADINWVLNYPGRVLGGHPMYGKEWDMLIGHPPCTYMCNSGVRWLYKRGTREPVPERWAALEEAVKFMGMLWSTKIPKVCLENPIMHKHARQRFGFDPTQIIQPWQFGHPETKATCLWLRGLPALQPTNIVAGRQPRVHHASPGPDRWRERSRTLDGIARAMAEQWG